jgi:hypothetical protein
MGWKGCVISTEPEGALESCAVARECGNPQRSLLRTAWFGNPRPQHRCRTIGSATQFFPQPLEFLPLVFGEIQTRLPVSSRSTFLAQHFTGRAEKVQVTKHLVSQRVPFSSSHFIFQKCLQHAIRPNRTMSPLVDPRRLSSRGSRERHCNRDVVPPFGGFTFQRFGHFTSTFLLPFAPPRFAARLHHHYESSDFYRAASTDVTGIAMFVPLRRAILHRGPGPLLTQRPPLRIVTTRRPRPSPDRSPCLSRLTFRPFHLQPPHCHFVTVAFARYFTAVTCRVYPPGQTDQVGGSAVARSRVRTSPGASPTGLAESSSLALRTGRSPQVALHPPSQERSYHCRIQAGNVSLVGTCTLLIKRLHRRTGMGILPMIPRVHPPGSPCHLPEATTTQRSCRTELGPPQIHGADTLGQDHVVRAARIGTVRWVPP